MCLYADRESKPYLGSDKLYMQKFPDSPLRFWWCNKGTKKQKLYTFSAQRLLWFVVLCCLGYLKFLNITQTRMHIYSWAFFIKTWTTKKCQVFINLICQWLELQKSCRKFWKILRSSLCYCVHWYDTGIGKLSNCRVVYRGVKLRSMLTHGHTLAAEDACKQTQCITNPFNEIKDKLPLF